MDGDISHAFISGATARDGFASSYSGSDCIRTPSLLARKITASEHNSDRKAMARPARASSSALEWVTGRAVKQKTVHVNDWIAFLLKLFLLAIVSIFNSVKSKEGPRVPPLLVMRRELLLVLGVNLFFSFGVAVDSQNQDHRQRDVHDDIRYC